MCRKLFCIISFVAALGMGLMSVAEAADPDLVAHWKFDETSGTVAFDATGNGHDGTIMGDPQWVPGKLGGALEFDGSGDYVDCGSSTDYQIPVNISITCWIKVDVFDKTWQAIITTSDSSWRVHRSGSTNNIAWGSTGLTPLDLTGTTDVSTGDWFHVAAVYNGAQKLLYINGELDASSDSTGEISTVTTPVFIGENSGATGRHWAGLIDDVRIYKRALTDVEILGVMAGGGAEYPQASGPTPPDGELFSETWANLSWRAGDFAVSHDLYFSDNLDDVSGGAPAAFQGNQTDTFYIVGFPGFPYPDGLVPGTTYYWRVDEINDAEPNSPWMGNVWSFGIPPRTAYNPVPGDGAKFVETDGPTLTWTAGFNAKLHTVYFGSTFEEVDTATGGAPVALTTFVVPGPLDPETTYYWRIDEFDPPATHKGPVWSFTTAREGGGVKGQYFQGMSPGGIPLVTRTDPQIDFSWGNGGPDPVVGEDNFSAIWTGEVEAAFTETYTFYTNSDDGVRLWIDGKQLVNNWTDHGTTEDRGTIDLVAGQTYSVVMQFYENGGGAVAQLRWASPSTAKQLIPQAALSFLVHAHSANPANGTEGLNLMSTLTWQPGEAASSHEVYLGTDADAVANATKASPEYKGSKALGEESLDPGLLDFDTTYYWRVDEVNATNPDSPWKGNVWSFWTGDFLVVDDFEAYNNVDPPDPASNRIFDNWIDGFGTTTNGALVGNDLPPYAETTIVHSGAQSMICTYDLTGKIAEATLTLAFPTDWTPHGVTKLSLQF
ncbi:MAG: LamG-like jellyroll fold domain-containing protein, partial [Planctomycetota bacterium]